MAWRLLLGLAVINVAVHLLSAGVLAWGYMTDELYYLDSINRLDWGFVDHPPLSIAILGAVRAVLGDSLFAIRVLPALMSGATVVLTGLMVREMGGGRTAQGLAGVAVLTNLLHLAICSFYSMNAIELALWATAMVILLRILNGGDHRLWLLLGVIMGMGLLNKASMLGFGAGLGVGLVLTPERRWLRTVWPWTAGVIALACLAPFVWWQWSHGWPFLEFNRNAAPHKIGHVSPIAFVREQILAMNPLAAPLVIGGLVYCWASDRGRRYRTAAWVFITVFLLLAFSGSARSHYLAPAYPIALAAGSVAMERLARGRQYPVALTATALVAVATASAPLAMPLLSPDATVRYQNVLGIRQRDEIQRGGSLPMHLGLQLHAAAVLKPVEGVYASLTPDERSRVEILTSYFGETGAVNVLGQKLGLPRSIGLHNQYGLWGPGDASGVLMIVVHNPADLDAWFTRCERRASIECPYCMELLQAQAVYLCRNARRPLREMWPQMRVYE